MTAAALLWVVLHTAPIEADGTLHAGAALALAAQQQWEQLAQRYAQLTDTAAPPLSRTLVLSRDPAPRPGHAGRSAWGHIWLRQAAGEGVAESTLQSLRHEVAHQFLWHVCPAASDDVLLHEAWALAVSGELEAWVDGSHGYVSTPMALRTLQEVASLNGPTARAALARLLLDGMGPEASLPDPLWRRLRLCSVGALPREPMQPEELSLSLPAADAWVVLSRHSGAVLQEQGASRLAMPFGSTLKPFVVAGAAAPPRLRAQAEQPQWRCGSTPVRSMDAPSALALSCNGYFLDWGQQAPQIAQLGAFGPLLLRLGLGRLPRHVSEAVGLRSSLRLSPYELAQAYRVLAEAAPQVVQTLERTLTDGTLRGAPGVAKLRGWAVKTGTVRDPHSSALLGWMVAVDADRVAVMSRRGLAPRAFVRDLTAALQRVPGDASGRQAAQVQVLGRLPTQSVQARCDGVPVRVVPGAVQLEPAVVRLGVAARRGTLMCLGAPWWVQAPDMRPAAPPPGRPYAGVFAWTAPDGPLVFRTTLADYTAGVLGREDAEVHGAARQALGRVIAHNVRHSRHGVQPVCDTTHCQVFQGTPQARGEALDLRPLPTTAWLPFARGGATPWQAVRSRRAVEGMLGGGLVDVSFRDLTVTARTLQQNGDDVFEDVRGLPCEVLRGALKLLSCPQRADVRGDAILFYGQGEGHGLGLDVEWAKRSGLSARGILRHAYGLSGQ